MTHICRRLFRLTAEFLLTCLLRGMTRHFAPILQGLKISTHMPLARHDSHAQYTDWDDRISTHMPLARHDSQERYLNTGGKFLLTCLLRGMTAVMSSHIMLSTFLLTCLLRGMTKPLCHCQSHLEFLLTCLLRGMTIFPLLSVSVGAISTHMPLARHDLFCLLNV